MFNWPSTPRWPALGVRGLRWVFVACIGFSWPALSVCGQRWVFVAGVSCCELMVLAVVVVVVVVAVVKHTCAQTHRLSPCRDFLAGSGCCRHSALVGLHWVFVACIGFSWPVVGSVNCCQSE